MKKSESRGCEETLWVLLLTTIGRALRMNERTTSVWIRADEVAAQEKYFKARFCPRDVSPVKRPLHSSP